MRRFGIVAACVLTACSQTYDEPPLTCTELRPGEPVQAIVGGSASSQAALGTFMEFAAIAATASAELTSVCAQIASDLGTPQDAIDTALGATKQDARAMAICQLAADALARGHEPIPLTIVTCTPVPQFSCVKTCVPTTMVCLDACDAAAGAKADCPEPSDIPLHFGPILAMRARLGIMAESADKVSADIATITDIKRQCIPYARDRMRDANAHVAVSQAAIEALIAAAGR